MASIESGVNSKFEDFSKQTSQAHASLAQELANLKQSQGAQDAKLLEALRDRELKAEKQHRELKAQIAEVRD